MALLVRVERGNDPILRTGFASSPVRVGRNPLNEVHLEDPVVSQWHGLIRFDEGKQEVTYMDLGSTNGTVLNGVPLAPHQLTAIGQNDTLTIGSLKINVVLAHVPPELLYGGGRSNFDPALAGGKATIAVSSDVAKTQVLTEDAAPTMLLDPGGAPTAIGSLADSLAEVDGAVAKTRPAYEAYRAAWDEVLRQARSRLQEAKPEMRKHVAFALRRQFPALSREPEFARLLEQMGLSEAIEEVDAAEWLHRLKYGAGAEVPRESINLRVAMERVGALLETFAESFVSLRRGYEQFGEDMALQVTREQSALSQAKDYRGVLQVMLDWNTEGGRVIDDVKRAFADLAIHQVALIHGFVEGVRDLVTQISPEALESAKSPLLPRGTSPPGFLGRRAKLWNLYHKVHRNLVEEDRFVRFVFGRAFARAYFNVSGGMIQEAYPRTRGLQ